MGPPQQLCILTMIVDGNLNKQTAGELNVSEQTVKVHVSGILRKLNVVSRTQATVVASRLGLAVGGWRWVATFSDSPYSR